MNQGQAVSGPLQIPVGSFEAMNLMWLVVSTPLKNMKVSWDYYIFPTVWKNKKCCKPPTRLKKKQCNAAKPSLKHPGVQSSHGSAHHPNLFQSRFLN